MAGRLTLKRVNALVSEEPRNKTKLPCARITSSPCGLRDPLWAGLNRFKGTFSVEVGDGFNTPSECAIVGAL
jgi:hypothetical protein